MSNFGAILTNAGAAKLANAIALGVPLKLTQMAVGDGNGQPVAPDPAMTAIPGEKRRAAINTLFADPLAASQLVAEQIIPEDVGGWWIRCVGLYDDSNTLIAIANVPDTYKPLLTSGAGRTQIIRMVLIVSDTSSVELKIDPAVVLATRKYVDDVMKKHRESRDHPYATTALAGLMRLATAEDAISGSEEPFAITPSLFKALAQPRRIIESHYGKGASFTKLCDMKRDPADSCTGLCALVSGGSDYAGTLIPSYLISFSTRGYSGDPSTLLRHIHVIHMGPGEHSSAVSFLVRDTGVRVELWIQVHSYPYPAAMQILSENNCSVVLSPPTTDFPAGAVTAIVHRSFTTLSPPSAANVGLGAVNNYPVATSLEDGSSQKYATASLTYQLAHLLQLHAAGSNHPNATTDDEGMIRIATQEQTDTGDDDATAITPKKLKAWVKQATESVLGLIKVATASQTTAGTADDVAVTPKKLKLGFNFIASGNGFIALPSWLGGLIIQWGSIPPIAPGASAVITYPTVFPNSLFVTIPIAGTSGCINALLSAGGGNALASFQAHNNMTGTVTTGTGSYIAVGR